MNINAMLKPNTIGY